MLNARGLLGACAPCRGEFVRQPYYVLPWLHTCCAEVSNMGCSENDIAKRKQDRIAVLRDWAYEKLTILATCTCLVVSLVRTNVRGLHNGCHTMQAM